MFASTATAQYQQVVDGFEDADIAEYGGDTDHFIINDTNVWEGSFSLQGKAEGGFYNMRSYSGLPTYPEQGDKLSFRFFGEDEGSNIARFLFKFGADPDCSLSSGNACGYQVQVRQPNDGGMSLTYVNESGVFDMGSDVSYSISDYTENWARMNVSWKQEFISVQMYNEKGTELASINYSGDLLNESLETGGIEWRHDPVDTSNVNPDAIVWFDSLAVKERLPEILSVSPVNNTTTFREYSRSDDLSWSVVTESGNSGYDINLLVKRPQYSGFQREASFFDNPDGTLTTTVNRNVSGQNDLYPNGDYWFRWVVGDCPSDETCTGAQDTLYDESQARVVTLRSISQPQFNLFDPSDGARISGFDADFRFFVDSDIAGNVSLRVNGTLLDGERVKNFTHAGDGYTEFNTTYTHPSTGSYEWGVVFSTEIKNETRTYSSQNLSYEILPESQIIFRTVNPEDGDVVTQDEIFLIGEVDSNIEGEVRLKVDDTTYATCPHDGGGETGCATETSIDLSAGKRYEWFIEFEDESGDITRSNKTNFTVVSDEDAVANISVREPESNELIRALRLFKFRADVISNLAGDVSVSVDGQTQQLCDQNDLDCTTSKEYSGSGENESITGYIDAAEFYNTNQSSYTLNVSFTSADGQFTTWETQDISVFNNTYDYELIQPEEDASYVVGQDIEFNWRTYIVPERIGDGAVRHALVVNGEEIRNVSQYAGGWIESSETYQGSALRKGTNQLWIRTYNDTDNPVDISDIREFSISEVEPEEQGVVESTIAELLLLQGQSQIVRIGLGTVYAMTVAAFVGWLTGSGAAFGVSSVFMAMMGASLPDAWYPEWLVVVFTVIAGGVLFYAVRS